MLQIIKDTFRLLTFRLTREEFFVFGNKHLIFGLICTWLVGIGRYWDNPQAVFNIMGGIREPSPNDSAYGVLLLLFIISIFLVPILLITYIVLTIKATRKPPNVLSIKDDSNN